ncbi:4-hydroxy-tetrahydrodipicolinate reductase [bacterium]|nr:4-hydroxy-tetrahydrodipicolinate reductase [bacterium]
MNIALVGYGKLGREIEKKATERGHKICLILNSKNNAKGESFTKENFEKIDVCFEATSPKTALQNILALVKLQKSVVVASTGWFGELETVKNEVVKNKTALFYASNFSVGVNLFFKVIETAAKLFSEKGFDCAVHELHHNKKMDSPSGTALVLAEKILQNFHSKTHFLTNLNKGEIDKNALYVGSTRLGSVIGTHSVFFDSEVDTVEITHTARNREGFAQGSVLCAEWILGKKGIFTMEDFLES